MSRIPYSQPSRKGDNRIPHKTLPPDKHIVFSFKFLKQINYFNWSNATSNQFTSFLLRLHDLESSYTKEALGLQSSSFHYHAVNFNQKNCPIRYEDIDWIPNDMKNPHDYPLYQISISSSKGRFHGIWEGNIFYILLLDFDHNMQPTKSRGYKVDINSEMPVDYDVLCACIQECRFFSECPCIEHIGKQNCISFRPDDNTMSMLDELSPQKADFSAIFSLGLEQYRLSFPNDNFFKLSTKD